MKSGKANHVSNKVLWGKIISMYDNIVGEFQQKNNFSPLSEKEFIEREMLLELQKSNIRVFTQVEFDRLRELSEKLFKNSGKP